MNRKIKIKGSLLSKDLEQVEVTTERAKEITVKITESSNQERPEESTYSDSHTELLSPRRQLARRGRRIRIYRSQNAR